MPQLPPRPGVVNRNLAPAAAFLNPSYTAALVLIVPNHPVRRLFLRKCLMGARLQLALPSFHSFLNPTGNFSSILIAHKRHQWKSLVKTVCGSMGFIRVHPCNPWLKIPASVRGGGAAAFDGVAEEGDD